MPATHHTFKQTAKREFAKWSQTYDRSILQTLLFQPTFEILLEETVRWRTSLADPAAPFDVLDIGCGTGRWPMMLRGSALPARVIGLDYSYEMCEKAVGNRAKLGFDDVPILNGDSEHLPLPDQSLDLITCTHSFHHYPHQAAVVQEMHRTLRPGGRLMLVDGFRDNVIGWVVFDIFVTRAEGDVHHAPWSQMRAYFESAGFQDIRQRKFNIWAPAAVTMGERV